VAEKFIAPLRLVEPDEPWNEERLIDADGEMIFIRYKGKPSLDRYEYIRDYLDLKIRRMKAGSVYQPG
jgi:hypothetical protein